MDSEQYEKSINDNKCVGPCYEKGTWIIHPLTLEYITDRNNSFCPTNDWLVTDPKTGKVINDPKTGEPWLSGHDICDDPVNKKDLSKMDIILNTLIPKVEFDCNRFLKLYYKISSFEDTLMWFNNHPYSPLLTKVRVMNCSIKAWGNKNYFSINKELIDFYITVIKKLWIKSMYTKIKKYIYIDNNKKIYLVKPTDNKNDDNDNNYKGVKINFIIKKFINQNILQKFFTGYIQHYKNDWSSIASHNPNIKKNLIRYILKKIHSTVDK
jgi:hypothetical protein